VKGKSAKAGDTTMKNTQENPSVSEITSSAAFPHASATLLILFGIVFQVVELAGRNVHFGNLWLLSVLASDIWNILSVHFNVPSFGAVLLYWPLAMICLGMAILLAARENRPSGARRS
jgi:uncharacterized membrane protein SirB2